MAMQYIEGVTLSEMLDAVGALEPNAAVALLSRLARALDEAHAHGLVHGDVKPSNVLLPRHEPAHPLLTDFGLARRLGVSGRFERFEGWLGTPQYVAPEQLDGGGADHRVDVYALAVMLFRCLAGELPFAAGDGNGARDARATGVARRLVSIRPELPDAIDEVLARGFAPPDERHASAGALMRDVAVVLGVPPSAGSWMPEPSLWRARPAEEDETPGRGGPGPDAGGR